MISIVSWPADLSSAKISIDWYITFNEIDQVLKRNKYRHKIGMTSIPMPKYRSLILNIIILRTEYHINIIVGKAK